MACKLENIYSIKGSKSQTLRCHSCVWGHSHTDHPCTPQRSTPLLNVHSTSCLPSSLRLPALMATHSPMSVGNGGRGSRPLPCAPREQVRRSVPSGHIHREAHSRLPRAFCLLRQAAMTLMLCVPLLRVSFLGKEPCALQHLCCLSETANLPSPQSAPPWELTRVLFLPTMGV